MSPWTSSQSRLAPSPGCGRGSEPAARPPAAPAATCPPTNPVPPVTRITSRARARSSASSGSASGPAGPGTSSRARREPYGVSAGSVSCTNESWPIFIAVVDRDRQVGDVRELERHVAVPARVDEAGGRVDQEPEPPERRLPLEPGDEVVRQRDPLERRAEHELARVEDERPLLVDLDELGQVLLRLLDVDERVARVAEDAEVAVDADVDARRLEQRRVVRVDLDAALVEQALDGSVGKDHAAILSCPRHGPLRRRQRPAARDRLLRARAARVRRLARVHARDDGRPSARRAARRASART